MMENHNQKQAPVNDPSITRFISDVSMTFGVKVLVVIIGVAAGIVVARTLGPAGRGAYALIATFPGLVLAFVHFGIAQANVYFLRRSEVKVDPAIIRINTVALTAAISVVTLLALWYLKPWLLSAVLKDLEPRYYTITLIIMPFFILETYATSFLVADERFTLINAITFVLRIVDTIAIIIVLLIFRMGLFGAALTLLGFYMADSLIRCYYVFWNQPIKKKPEFGVIKRSLAYGLKSHVQTLIGFLHFKIDIFIIAAFLSTTEVGYYSIAVGLVSLILFIPESVGVVLFPRLASLDDVDADGLTSQVCRNTLFIAAFPAVGMLLFGRIVIRMMYGVEFLPASQILYYLVPGTMAMCLYVLLSRYFTSRNKQQITIGAGAIGLIVNVGLNLILIPKLGISGAAIATTASYSVTSLLLLFFFLRESGHSLLDSVVVKHSDIIQLSQLVGKTIMQKAKT